MFLVIVDRNLNHTFNNKKIIFKIQDNESTLKHTWKKRTGKFPLTCNWTPKRQSFLKTTPYSKWTSRRKYLTSAEYYDSD